jgi:[ribosomal protein S5]-alanine N-acetyltransferase
MDLPEGLSPVEIVTERLVLRMALPADVPRILRYFHENREHLAPFEPWRPPEFFTDQFWRDQIGLAHREFEQDRSMRLFLFDRRVPDEVVGVANFTSIIRGAFHACNLGYSLRERDQGRGLMHEALRYAIAFAFDDLHLHRVQANYMPHNRRSGTLLRRLGFGVEGYARDYLRIDGRWEDHVLTSLTNSRWTAP